MKIGLILSLFGAMGFMSGTATAAELRVPDDYARIQEAIEAAGEGDIVAVAPGVYFQKIDFLGKAITVRSEAGPSKTTINGLFLGSVVTFSGGETEAAVLEGFTVKAGLAEYGGGVYSDDSTPTIRNCRIMENMAFWGGGGIYSDYYVILVECEVKANLAGYSGGGIEGGVVAERSRIVGNFAGQEGGGINGDFDLTNCFVSKNFAICGGGCHFYPDPWQDASGRYVSITNCTITMNIAAEGPGVWAESAHVTNSIFWGNVALLYPVGSYQLVYGGHWGGDLVVDHCVVQFGRYGCGSYEWGEMEWLDGNLALPPLLTLDGHLTPLSPCIDAGKDAGVYDDIDGEKRPMGGAADIGADESDVAAPCFVGAAM